MKKLTNRKLGAAAVILALAMALTGCSKTDNGSQKEADASESVSSSAQVGDDADKAADEAPVTNDEAQASDTAESSNTADSGNEDNSGGDEAGASADLFDYLPDDLTVQPALWKASDPATGNSIYLFGTIHVTPEGVSPIADYVADAIGESDYVTIEFDTSKLATDLALAQEYQAGLIYSDGSLLKDHISEEAHALVEQFADTYLGGWQELYDYYNTGFWISNISSAGLMSIKGLSLTASTESYLIDMAAEKGKEVKNVETMAECLAYVNAYGDKFADYVIKENLKGMQEGTDPESSGEIAESLAEIYTAWASGDIDGVYELSYAEYEDAPEEIRDEVADYMQIMYYTRNAYMAERAAEYIKNGQSCVFTVGFAHYAGDKGIVALLTDMGYTVERVH